MKLSREKCITFKFNEKEISIEFHVLGTFKTTTYCTISIKEDGKWKHYHDGIVLNPHDHCNIRTGYFLAFKKALKQRWDSANQVRLSCVANGIDFDKYHKFWAHYLAQLMDGKPNGDNTNQI